MKDMTPGSDPGLKTRTTQIWRKRQIHRISKNCGTSPVTKACTGWKAASSHRWHPIGWWERTAGGGLRTLRIAKGSREGSPLAGSPGTGHRPAGAPRSRTRRRGFAGGSSRSVGCCRRRNTGTSPPPGPRGPHSRSSPYLLVHASSSRYWRARLSLPQEQRAATHG